MVFLRPVERCFVARVVTKISSCRVIVVCRQSEAVMEPPTPKEVSDIFLKGISAKKGQSSLRAELLLAVLRWLQLYVFIKENYHILRH